MTHWTNVFLFELRQKFRSKSYLFVTFGLPILAIVLFFAYQAYQDFSSEEEDTANPITETADSSDNVIGYVDQTPQALFPAPESYDAAPEDCQVTAASVGDLTPDVIKRITAPYCMRGIVRAYDSREAGEQALRDGDLDALYVIGPDYLETGEVAAYSEGFSLESASTETLMNDYLLASLLSNVEPEAYERLYLRLRDPAVIVENKLAGSNGAETANEDQGFALVYGFGLLLMMTVLWGGGYVMQSVVQEKESRAIEILLSSVRPNALLTGKVLAMGLLALVQMGMLLGTFVFLGSRAGSIFESLGDIEVETGTLILFGVYFVLDFLMIGSLLAGVGAVSTSVRDGQNFVSVITLPTVVPFFFLTMFVEEPNGTLARVLSLFPITSPLSMVMRLSVTDVPALDLAISLGLLVLTVVGALWLAGRLFRINTLLAGNTPKLRDLPKLLRG